MVRFQMVASVILVENAKLFKEDLLRRNVKNSNTLNLQSLRLGINAIIALSNALQTRKVRFPNIKLPTV